MDELNDGQKWIMHDWFSLAGVPHVSLYGWLPCCKLHVVHH